MKKFFVFLGIVLLLGVSLIGCSNPLDSLTNEIGKDQYYVQITDEGKKLDDKKDSNYEYTLPAYDKNGKEKTITFNGLKQLRKDAYLRLYYSEKRGVTSYKEVKENELPEKVKEKLNVK
ncbi:hypothetical protein CLPU_23c00320 [Gottschalkia purinilytica]|uniref:YxeA family protein n=1 Tax=Gottschalkia purinilytica TaxID=1503 RepID=A0A0L0W6J6_GOTPU|nr:YxeA family protein [Gottschalkia purinilytica]KNF07149.1 hypothetical protein CLPU_23c00320 [Gottschalkia purinilytica]